MLENEELEGYPVQDGKVFIPAMLDAEVKREVSCCSQFVSIHLGLAAMAQA